MAANPLFTFLVADIDSDAEHARPVTRWRYWLTGTLHVLAWITLYTILGAILIGVPTLVVLVWK